MRPVPAAPKSLNELPTVSLPASQDDAVSDAVQAAASRLKGKLSQSIKGPSKGFQAAGSAAGKQCLAIEIPVADQGHAATAQLACDIAARLVSSLGCGGSAITLVFVKPEAAAAANADKQKPSGARVLELKEACRMQQLVGGLLIVAAPSIGDVALCEQLIEETWTGQSALLLNAEFLTAPAASLSIPAEFIKFCEQAVMVYCLMPVAVKGLLGAMEGAVLRQQQGGKEGVWKVLMQAPGSKAQDNKYVQIGQTKKRPSSDDIQLVFINANAARSPLTQLVSKIKGKK